MSQTKVIINAHFPGIKPAHHAFISKQGEGSNWAVAVCDAVRKIKADEKLKGRKASAIFPGQFKINIFTPSEEQD